MTLSLPFPAALLALLTGERKSALPAPGMDMAPPETDRLRRDIGLPEPAAPPALTVALRARGDL